MSPRDKNILVLMGGTSCERDVSLISGAAVAGALAEAGYHTVTVDIGNDMGTVMAAMDPEPDAIFNSLHGRYGEDGCIQGLLELLQIPYTHSGVLASALAMNKPMAKNLFRTVSIPCAKHIVAHRDDVFSRDPLPRPYVIKPINEGSSVGVQIVRENANLPELSAAEWPFGDQVMVESYIAGRELTVAVMGDRALGVTELDTSDGFYDYDAKYTNGLTKHTVPAVLPASVYQAALDHAIAAHAVLGCRGVSRADFRYDDTQGDPGELYMLEVNTQPGMTPLSLVPELAEHAGISFVELVSWMVENAACDG